MTPKIMSAVCEAGSESWAATSAATMGWRLKSFDELPWEQSIIKLGRKLALLS